MKQRFPSTLHYFDADSASAGARIESRRREGVRPPVSVYRWWARRTSAITGALLDAALEADRSISLICDPFSGGGGVGLEAATRGLTAYVQDIEPWAALGVAQMLDLPDKNALRAAETRAGASLGDLLRTAYGTEHSDGTPATIAHTFRVAVGECVNCGASVRLFPYALLTRHQRSTRDGVRGWLACTGGHLFEGDPENQSCCPDCSQDVDPAARYTVGRSTTCPQCQHRQRISDLTAGKPLGWEVVLVHRVSEERQEIVPPSSLELHQAADDRWSPAVDLGPIHNVGPGVVLMLQFKAPWSTSVVDSRYKFSINERQHEALEDLAARYPEAVHYVFPFFTTWSKAREYAPNLVQDTWLVPASSIPLAELQAASSPKTGRHRVELERTGSGIDVTVHSPRVVGEAINAGDFLAGPIVQTTSRTLSRPLVPHGLLRDWIRAWDEDSRAVGLTSDELPRAAAVSAGRVRFRGLSALYIPSSPSNA